MYLKNYFIILALIISKSSFSQFSDSVNHHFSFSSTAIYNKTKELRSFVLNNATAYEVRKKKVAFNASASWIYGNQNKKLSNNDVSASANIDYLKDTRALYYWGLINFDESVSLKINYRFQSGAGLGYNVIKSPNLTFGISDGFVYETSDLTDPRIGKDIYQTVRNSLRVKYRWSYKEKFVLEGGNFFQPSMISLKDYIIKLNNQLTVKLNKWLALNASMNYNKISRTNRENLIITYGITIENYF